MDLTKKGHLTEDEKLAIAQEMQINLLDEIARNTRWRVGDAAFHGGTCIRAAWASDRWSEDLDFLLSMDQRASLMKAVPKVASAFRARMGLHYPGCSVEFQVKPGDEAKEDVMDVWFVKWQHPKRVGKVLVKAEFYAAQPGLLSVYKAALARPGHSSKKVSVEIPVADLVSLWADKVKAIATRPHFKWRDAYDLGFIADSLDRKNHWPGQMALIEALSTSGAIYDKSLGDISCGLEVKLDDGHFGELQVFTDDMARWIPPTIHQDFAERGLFAQILGRAEDEIRKTLEFIQEASPEKGKNP